MSLIFITRIIRAYALGYVSVTGPRLLSLLSLIRRNNVSIDEKLRRVLHVFRTATHINRFPTTCAIIVAGSTIIPRLVINALRTILNSFGRGQTWLKQKSTLRLIHFLSSFLSAWLSFLLLNSNKKLPHRRISYPPVTDKNDPTRQPRETALVVRPNLAGYTLDFTLFALVRALDATIGSLWTRQSHHIPSRPLKSFTTKFIDPLVFSSSVTLIMWSWFYHPTRLPSSYNTWITRAASLDTRLLHALRAARSGDWLYGTPTPAATILEPTCTNNNMPAEWGNPAKTIPIPCSVVHLGTTSSCELHALQRFKKGFLFAMRMYLPLQLFLRLRHASVKSLAQAIIGASQSSAFLGSFVALVYYGVCLARTRLGPKLFSRKTVTPQMWDGGLCVLSGCLLCGWSILLEKRSRRMEIAFFVAPRALATVVPRRYDRKVSLPEYIRYRIIADAPTVPIS
ncbi:MAG: hypothetical protein Q9160_001411 [Pyrenula sp. 1 TL-2023]